MKEQFEVSREILIYAFRYAIGRQSSAPDNVIEAIKDNITTLSDHDIELYIREINECTYYGMECDKINWLNLKKYLQNVLNERR